MSKPHPKPPKRPESTTQTPPPFTKAPSSLLPFLERLNPAQVHITHIDRLPAAYKRKIFAIPVILNGVIAVLLAWRLYVAVPTYWLLLLTLLGQSTSATVDPTSTTRRQQFGILFRRTLMFAVDFLLFRFVLCWPLTFFVEQPHNPVSWRWGLGFRKEEIVVRVSRNWGAEDLMKGTKKGEDNAFFKTRVLPAIEPGVVRKTGYLTMDRSWDLEFELMLDAHALVAQGKVMMEELDKVVLVFQEGVGWLVWRWEGANDVVEERRKKVIAFKERLTAMGKESLFWRWTEIVEEERDRDGGFTPERQQKTVKRVQLEFEKNGVDFEEVIKSIGGFDELPTPSTT